MSCLIYSCENCTNSPFNCQWCYAKGQCLSQDHSCPSTSGIDNSNSCPMISMSSQDKDVLVHAGQEREVSVQVKNLQQQQRYDDIFN